MWCLCAGDEMNGAEGALEGAEGSGLPWLRVASLMLCVLVRSPGHGPTVPVPMRDLDSLRAANELAINQNQYIHALQRQVTAATIDPRLPIAQCSIQVKEAKAAMESWEGQRARLERQVKHRGSASH